MGYYEPDGELLLRNGENCRCSKKRESLAYSNKYG